MGGQAINWWPGGGRGKTVHGVGGQAGWPETVEEDVEGISVDWRVARLGGLRPRRRRWKESVWKRRESM